MAKATYVPGGLNDDLSKTSDKAPGPGYYFKDLGQKSFVSCARGGKFSKVTRECGKIADKSPSVGTYDTLAAFSSQISKRTRGGLMARNDRICAFAKMAEKANIWNSNGPGKYDSVRAEKHQPCPGFHSPKTESRVPRKNTQVGPGYYNPNYVHIDKKTPSYSGSKEESGSLMSKLNKDKIAQPFPGYKDMPESKVQDRHGTRKHCKELLHDRQVTPRNRPAATGAASRTSPRPGSRSATPRGATPRGAPREVCSTPLGMIGIADLPDHLNV